MKKHTLNTKGFTLVEIMIVVAITGLLSAIAIPNFINSRNKAIENTCLANIKQLEDGLEVAALSDNASIANLDEAGIEAVVVSAYIKKMPDCPYGTYSTNADGNVSCSEHSVASGGSDDDGDDGPPPASPFF